MYITEFGTENSNLHFIADRGTIVIIECIDPKPIIPNFQLMFLM